MNSPLRAVGEVTPDSGSPAEFPRAGVNAGMCWGLQISDHEKQCSWPPARPFLPGRGRRLTPGDLLSRAKALGLISPRNNSGPSGGAMWWPTCTSAVPTDCPAPGHSLNRVGAGHCPVSRPPPTQTPVGLVPPSRGSRRQLQVLKQHKPSSSH